MARASGAGPVQPTQSKEQEKDFQSEVVDPDYGTQDESVR